MSPTRSEPRRAGACGPASRLRAGESPAGRRVSCGPASLLRAGESPALVASLGDAHSHELTTPAVGEEQLHLAQLLRPPAGGFFDRSPRFAVWYPRQTHS